MISYYKEKVKKFAEIWFKSRLGSVKCWSVLRLVIKKSNGVFRNLDNLITPFLISHYQIFFKIIKKRLKKP